MPVTVPCPNCSNQSLYRSRSKNRLEHFIKKILPYRTYRCHDCQWRGWISQRRVKGKTALIRLGFYYLAVMLFSFIMAWFLWNLLH